MELLSRVLEKYKSEPQLEYLNSIQENKILKVKNSLQKYRKDFRELKDRETKIRKEMGDLLTKPISLLRPKKYFFKTPTPSPTPKSQHTHHLIYLLQIWVNLKKKDDEEDIIYKRKTPGMIG